MLVDSHCHLDFDSFDDDRPEVIARAREAGVHRIVIPALDLDNSQIILGITDRVADSYAAVGVHPNSALTWTAESPEKLNGLTRHAKVVAIGEIGLDYYRDWAPQEIQREILRIQLKIASEKNLPVIIHVRDASTTERSASEDLITELENWHNHLVMIQSSLLGRAGVLHAFSGDLKMAELAIELGFYIGIGGPVTYRNSTALQQVVARLPLERIIIETDAPFLPPHPYRGKRNEPAYVRLVADKIADIHHLQVNAIAQITTSNSERLFNW